MKNLLIILALFTVQLGFGQDISRYFTEIANGNINQMSQKFSSTMEVCVNDSQDFMSKSEAIKSINDFLTRVRPTSGKQLHTGSNKSGSKYSVGKITTSKGNYRVFISIESKGSDYEIVSVVFNPE